MAEKKTIKDLYNYVKSILSSTENLKSIYIGKTSSVRNTEKRYQNDYDETHIIVSGTPNLVSKAEDFFIKHLKEDLQGVKVDNKNEGSGGSTTANMLYISWNVKYENIEQLFEPDFESYDFELIEG